MLDLDRFWILIEQTRQQLRTSVDADRQEAHQECIALAETLYELTPPEIVQFDQRFEERIIAAYHWGLWGALNIFTEGCAGDDRFEHFRAELILCGRQAFEAALDDADSLADLPYLPRGEEGLIAVPLFVYEEKTGTRFPDYDLVVPHPAEPAGQLWEEADLPRRLPRMWKKYGADLEL
jgi:hypothetical protein